MRWTLGPSRPGGKTTVIWVGCDPDPFGLGRSACNDTSALLMPTSFTTFPEGVRILGIGNKASYASPERSFVRIAVRACCSSRWTGARRNRQTTSSVLASSIGSRGAERSGIRS